VNLNKGSLDKIDIMSIGTFTTKAYRILTKIVYNKRMNIFDKST